MSGFVLLVKCCCFIGGAADKVPLQSLSVFSFQHTHFQSQPPSLSLLCVRATVSTYHGGTGRLPWQSAGSARSWRRNRSYIFEKRPLLVFLKHSPSLLHTHTHRDASPHTRLGCPWPSTPKLRQTNTLKCILFQNGGPGCRGWVPLIREPGTTTHIWGSRYKMLADFSSRLSHPTHI